MVLEPNFDMAVSELQQRSHFKSPVEAQVSAEVKLLLQLEQLGGGERCMCPFTVRTAAAILYFTTAVPGITWKTFRYTEMLKYTRSKICQT